MRNPFRKKKPDPEVQAAYDKAFREAQLEKAAKLGREAGLKKRESVLDKMTQIGNNVLKSGVFSEPAPSKKQGSLGDMEDLGDYLIGTPKKKKKRKRRK